MTIALPVISIVASAVASTFFTSPDANFASQTTQFSTNQTVYLKLESGSSGEKAKVFRLLDSNKNEIGQYSLSLQSEDKGKYVFTSTFKAPGRDGIYYIDIKLDDGKGSTFAGQKNINVGAGGGDVRSSVESHTSVNTNSSTSNGTQESIKTTTQSGERVVYTQKDTDEDFSTSSGSILGEDDGKEAGKERMQKPLLNQLEEFIRNIFSYIFRS